MSSANLLLHPLRLRIVQAFLGDRELTTGQLLAEMDGIPPATLYRQIAMLARAGVLVVVDERQVRGTVERTYALSVPETQVGAEDLHDLTADDHRRGFIAFLAGLLGDFDRYLDSGAVDLEVDGAGYRSVGLWLTDDELTDMVDEIATAVRARGANRPEPGRMRRILSTVLVPVPGGESTDPDIGTRSPAGTGPAVHTGPVAGTDP